MKTHKLMEVQMEGHGDYLICVKDTRQKWNQYVIYVKWYDMGWHKKKLEAYADYLSVIEYVRDVMIGKIRL